VAALLCIAAASCSGSGGGEAGGPAAAFVGGAAVDEPRAALVARDILAAGGSAVDAAAAAYFALSVTMPASASLGGGGVCLVFDARLGRIEAVDFMARPGAGTPAPMNARGFFVMQSRYGRLRWEQIVAPAEGMARFGVPVSRALARDIANDAGSVSRSPALARLLRPNGVPLREADRLVQPELADTLAIIRVRGAREFHDGPEAASFVAAARAAGATFTAAEFAAAAPRFRTPLTVTLQETRIVFAPPPASIGIFQAQLAQMLAPRLASVSRDEQPHLLVEAQKRAFADAQRWNALDLDDFAAVGEAISPPRAAALMADYRAQQRAPTPGIAIAEDPGVATIVAADREGGAVSCAVGAGGMFGSGRMARGVILAAPSEAGGRGVASLAPMMATRSYGGAFSLSPRANTAQLVFAGAAGGGPGAAAALVATGMMTLVERRALGEAIDLPRLAVAGGDAVRAEPGAVARYPGLAARGHALVETPAIGRINAIFCPGGLIDDPTSCRVRSDERGNGLAVGGVR
jgi:gamma-glutamyltranspeptidase/glutathione hydrolase